MKILVLLFVFIFFFLFASLEDIRDIKTDILQPHMITVLYVSVTFILYSPRVSHVL